MGPHCPPTAMSAKKRVFSRWFCYAVGKGPLFFCFPKGFAIFVCGAMLGRNTTDHYIHYTRTCWLELSPPTLYLEKPKKPSRPIQAQAHVFGD